MSYYQTIYNRLRQYGITQAGALAMLGNFECESNCEPNRVQGDGSSYRTISKQYTANYMNGVWGQDKFVNGKTGYGLAQWTYPTRQAELWLYWKASGKALDDCVMQCDFSVHELKRDFPELWRLLCTSNDTYTLTKRVCYDFENPLVKNVDARYAAAKRIKGMIDLDGDCDAQPEPEPVDDHKLALRTTDERCSGWPEAYLVQALLMCRGYKLPVIDGSWDDEDTNAVRQFQRDKGLSDDGIVGPKTWAKLLER